MAEQSGPRDGGTHPLVCWPWGLGCIVRPTGPALKRSVRGECADGARGRGLVLSCLEAGGGLDCPWVAWSGLDLDFSPSCRR